MIKAWYGPATEDLVEQLIPRLSGRESTGEIAEYATLVINELRGLGYDITIEVEVHGDMAKAIGSLGDSASNYVTVQIPKRKHGETCTDDCPDHILVGQILECASAGLRTDPGFERKLHQCLRILREDLGYEISVEVEVQ